MREMLAQEHGDTVRLLATRASGAPDMETSLGGAFGQQLRHDGSPQRLERMNIAEEISLVRSHGLHDLLMETVGAFRLQPTDQLSERAQTRFTRDRQQTRF